MDKKEVTWRKILSDFKKEDCMYYDREDGTCGESQAQDCNDAFGCPLWHNRNLTCQFCEHAIYSPNSDEDEPDNVKCKRYPQKKFPLGAIDACFSSCKSFKKRT